MSTQAATCPHCGAQDPTGALAAHQAAEQRRSRGWFLGCAGVLLLLATGFGLWASRVSDSPEALRADALATCQGAVEQRMTIPFTFIRTPDSYTVNPLPVDSNRVRVRARMTVAGVNPTFDCWLTRDEREAVLGWRVDSVRLPDVLGR